jgi:hypothetical protein
VDSSLVRFDRALGFDWPAVYRWVQSHHEVQRILAFAYVSGEWQLIAIPFILGLSGRCEDLSDFFFFVGFVEHSAPYYFDAIPRNKCVRTLQSC